MAQGRGLPGPLSMPPPSTSSVTWSYVAAPRGGAACCPLLLTAQACEEHEGPTHVPSSAGRLAPRGSVGALPSLPCKGGRQHGAESWSPG